MNQTRSNFNFSESELENLEKNLTWVFTSMGMVDISNWFFRDHAQIVNEPWLGQHLGIITDRRGENIETNFELHGEREDYIFCKKFKVTWLFYLRNLILGRLYYQFGNTSRPIIVGDLPSANFASNILTEATPDSKVLIFLRDIQDVVNYKADSLLSNGKELRVGLSAFSQKNKNEFLRLESRKLEKMNTVIQDIKKNHDEKLVKLVWFNDLAGNTSKVVSDIFEFMNIKPERNQLSEIVVRVQKRIFSSRK